MSTCPNCNTQLNDGATFCPSCGHAVNAQGAPQGMGMPQGAPQYQYAVPVFDHTAEFDAKDISDNKVVSMLVYLLGPVGIVIALLASANSPYAGFHVRQALKFVVIETLVGLIALVLCWTLIIPIAAGLFYIVLFVVQIICFFRICGGKAIEPPIIRSFGFLK